VNQEIATARGHRGTQRTCWAPAGNGIQSRSTSIVREVVSGRLRLGGHADDQNACGAERISVGYRRKDLAAEDPKETTPESKPGGYEMNHHQETSRVAPEKGFRTKVGTVIAGSIACYDQKGRLLRSASRSFSDVTTCFSQLLGSHRGELREPAGHGIVAPNGFVRWLNDEELQGMESPGGRSRPMLRRAAEVSRSRPRAVPEEFEQVDARQSTEIAVGSAVVEYVTEGSLGYAFRRRHAEFSEAFRLPSFDARWGRSRRRFDIGRCRWPISTGQCPAPSWSRSVSRSHDKSHKRGWRRGTNVPNLGSREERLTHV